MDGTGTGEENIMHNKEEEILNHEQVHQWLNAIHLDKYYTIFIENGYASIDYIMEIKEISQLIEIGIHNQEDQRKILKEISDMVEGDVVIKYDEDPDYKIMAGGQYPTPS